MKSVLMFSAIRHFSQLFSIKPCCLLTVSVAIFLASPVTPLNKQIANDTSRAFKVVSQLVNYANSAQDGEDKHKV